MLLLGLLQAQAKLELLNFPNESSSNMHYSTKLGMFIVVQVYNLYMEKKKSLSNRLRVLGSHTRLVRFENFAALFLQILVLLER